MAGRGWLRALTLHGPFGAVLVLVLLLRVLSPRTLHGLLQEDGLAEWATFSAFALAAAVYLRAARHSTGWARLVALALGGFSVFVAGEEISWGQRLVSFRPPDLFLAHNFQQEANLHNFLKHILDTRFVVAALCLLYAAAALPPASRRLPAALSPRAAIWPQLLVVAGLELIYPFELVGEAAELLFGLALLPDAFARLAGDQAAPAPLRAPAAIGAALLAGAALAPITDAITTSAARARLPQAQEQLAGLERRFEDEQPWRPALLGKKRVHKRLFTATQARYLDLGEGYFLDAWNQPLWAAFARTGRGRGKLLVYSFGPNRRRDTNLDRLRRTSAAGELLAGDDLGFLLELGSAPTTTTATGAGDPR